MGIDWTSDASVQAQQNALRNLDLVLFGITLWFCVVSAGYDIDTVFKRKRPFRWPMLIYWATKYSLFWFVTSVNIPSFQLSNQPLTCQALGDFTDIMARIAMAGSSALLMIRAIALWQKDLRVIIPLGVLHAAQWGLYLHNVFIVKEQWAGTYCQFLTVTWDWLKVQFIFTMVFDLIVLLLVVAALFRIPGRSSLWKMLFADGVVYFVIAFGGYLACTVLAYLNISIILSYMFSDAATVATAFAATHSFLRVGNYAVGNSMHPPTSSVASMTAGLPTVRGWKTGLGVRSRAHEVTVGNVLCVQMTTHVQTTPDPEAVSRKVESIPEDSKGEAWSDDVDLESQDGTKDAYENGKTRVHYG